MLITSTYDSPPVIGPLCTNSAVLPALRKLWKKKQTARAFRRFAAIHLTKRLEPPEGGSF